MSDEEDKLKIHIHYGGLLVKKKNKLSYIGGSIAPDMVVDPDYLTFSIFEDFTKNKEVKSDVEKVWYRLPNEDISAARCIYMDKDNEIMKMSLEAKEFGEVYIYVEYSVSPPNIIEDANLVNEVGDKDGKEECLNASESSEEDESDGENREEESEESDEERQENREEEGGAQSEDENQIKSYNKIDYKS